MTPRLSDCSVVGSEKPVFGAEYCDATEAGNGITLDPGCYCPERLAAGHNVLIKTTNLDDKVSYGGAQRNKDVIPGGASVTIFNPSNC